MADVFVAVTFGNLPIERPNTDHADASLYIVNPGMQYAGHPGKIVGWSYYAKRRVSTDMGLSISTWRHEKGLKYRLMGIDSSDDHDGNLTVDKWIEERKQWEVMLCNNQKLASQ